ncbi:MAG: acetylglutamate kinase [Phycisphaerales bacterium]|jgi:acetylglutamate kinase
MTTTPTTTTALGHGPIIIKIGGTTLEEQRSQPGLWKSVAALARRHAGGVILVHGGGKAVDRHLAKLGFSTERREGIRITPEDQVEQIAAVLAGSVNKSLVGSLLAAGAMPVGLCLGDGDAVPTRKATRYAFDPGRVGEMAGGGDGRLLHTLVREGFLPVLCSIGIDREGGFLNVNADDAAAGAATLLGASALVLLTDVPGVLDAEKRVIPELDAAAIESLVQRGVISGGMIPKVRAALEASSASGAPVVILDGNAPAALEAWIDAKPVGTRILGAPRRG